MSCDGCCLVDQGQGWGNQGFLKSLYHSKHIISLPHTTKLVHFRMLSAHLSQCPCVIFKIDTRWRKSKNSRSSKVAEWHKGFIICWRHYDYWYLTFCIIYSVNGLQHARVEHMPYLYSECGLTQWAGDTDSIGAPGGCLDKSSDTERTDMDSGTCKQFFSLSRAKIYINCLEVWLKHLKQFV